MAGDSLSDRLDAAVARGLLGIGSAHRVALATRLASTLPGAGSEIYPVLSGEELGRILGLSRAAVHKHVEHLRSLGFGIAPIAGSGYRLEHPFTDLVAAEAVLPRLLECVDPGPPWVAGLPYQYLAACGSTNQVLKQAAASSPSGAAVVTDDQRGGRGRLGRTWVSQPGKDLTFSVLLHPALVPAQAHLLSLAAALAVAEVLEGIPGLGGRVGIKWPNDVLLSGDKVCGILLEGSMDADRLHWAVAGIGLNVNSDPAGLVRGLPPEAREEWMGRPRPASLRAQVGRDVPRAPLLGTLLARLTERWTDLEAGSILEGLRRRDVLAGRRVEVLSGPPRNELVVAGESLGIGPEGQLLVRTAASDTVAVFAGDVTVRGMGA
jgi:BirA family biotin operon repressor/biotin-[acetyl-CoA-carboxylase] ligase